MKNWLISLFLFCHPALSWAALVYQNFEPGNGTPPSFQAPAGSEPEYGWGFNGAVVSLSQADEPVQEGKNSWKVTIPAGPLVNAGAAIPAQSHTYNVNFIPECYDRLTFWVWSAPSDVGDHTVMIKFFDQGKYKHDGIGIWTPQKAAYRQWTKLTILLSSLPADFNTHRVDKIEFFAYWDGTYFLDDIQIGSQSTPEQDRQCLSKEHYVSCAAPGMQRCMSIFSHDSTLTLDYWLLKAQQRRQGLALINNDDR